MLSHFYDLAFTMGHLYLLQEFQFLGDTLTHGICVPQLAQSTARHVLCEAPIKSLL